ncbi:hypothetical protein [Haladaptatus sp. NG-SE-30]
MNIRGGSSRDSVGCHNRTLNHVGFGVDRGQSVTSIAAVTIALKWEGNFRQRDKGDKNEHSTVR